jgi:tetratricopeptide (TPR) repeat protein
MVALLGVIGMGMLVVSVRGGSGPDRVHARVPLSASGVTPGRENVAPGFAREVAALEHRLSVGAADSAALHRLARLYQDAHQPARASAYYRRYLREAPNDRQAWLDLASVSAAAGEWNAALAATDSLLARDSLDPAALFNGGAIHANQGDSAAARRWWLKAAAQRRDPELAAAAASALKQLSGRP